MLRVIFQPALPMRGVTSPSSDDRATVSFQPALPMRGVTMTKLTRGFTFLFQPALPMRGVTAGDDGRCVTGHISTRTPHAGSDLTRTPAPVLRMQFQPALPMRGVTLWAHRLTLWTIFQPALPMRGVTLPHHVIEGEGVNFNPHSPCGE